MSLLLILGLILVTGVFVCVEMALFSVRSERLQVAATSGDGRAAIALRFLSDPPRFLSTIQIATTLMSILVGALGDGAVAQPLQRWYVERGIGVEAAQGLSFWSAVGITTFASLIFANLFPKQIGFVYAEPVVLLSARAAQVYVTLTAPLAWVLEKTTKALSTLFRVPISAKNRVNEGDILVLMEEGLASGGLDRHEREIARNAFRLSDIRVDEVMTPRAALTWIDLETQPHLLREAVVKSGRSFLPVVEGGLENVVGELRTRDILALAPKLVTGEKVRELMHEALIVGGDERLLSVVVKLRESPARTALVRGPKGQIVGLVSLNDVVSAIVGPVASLRT